VRGAARRLGLAVADRPESQDVCFGDYKNFVESLADPEDIHGGEVVDQSGKVLGRHDGIHRLTIGQRRGLGISSPYPLYVLEIDEATKRVVVGPKEELDCHGLVARSVNWIEAPEEDEIAAQVQVRYRSPSIPCRVSIGEDGTCEARFEDAFPSVPPGQAAVFYDGDRVLGGGWIERKIQ
jgi:tRNA-specific 2-thiouridylase